MCSDELSPRAGPHRTGHKHQASTGAPTGSGKRGGERSRKQGEAHSTGLIAAQLISSPARQARAANPLVKHGSVKTNSLHYLQGLTAGQPDVDTWGTFLSFITLINLAGKGGTVYHLPRCLAAGGLWGKQILHRVILALRVRKLFQVARTGSYPPTNFSLPSQVLGKSPVARRSSCTASTPNTPWEADTYFQMQRQPNAVNKPPV